ncbi:YbbR-like domain-containing protein [Caldicellulosiruptoraceae bacterium PP1]
MKLLNIKKVNDDTFYIKVISIVIAIILWFYVNSIINPIKKKEIIVPIKYNTTTLSKGLIMTETSSKETRLVISGTQDELNKIDESAIQAVVDFSNVHTIGEVKLGVTIHNLPNRVNLENQYPKAVNVSIDNIISIQRSVDTELKGKAKEGYIVYNVQEEPNVITIKGAESDVRQISKCLASLDLSFNDRSFKASIPIKIIDNKGKDITNLFELSQKSIDIYVDILKTKQVPLTIKFKGQLPSDRIISKVVMKPSVINIAGKPEDVDNLTEIVVGTIDVKNLSSYSTYQFNFSMPKDVKNLDKVKQVEINIWTDKVYEKTLSIPIDVKTADNSFEYVILQNSIKIVIKGPQSTIDKITADNFKATINVDNPQEGKIKVPLNFEKPQNVEISNNIPEYIEVEIKKKE